ncbi:MAG: sulfite exporter TauE/SafE family protein [Rickettsiales bacterium]|nr:sulfite exporter TauE/SafE family protein [Rickettsiales bacterium]
MLLSFLCGVLPGTVFGLIGVGSGIFAILLFNYVLKLPIHVSLPLALLLTFIASLFTVSKSGGGRCIPRSGVMIIVGVAVLMSPVGVFVSEKIDAQVLKNIFNIFMVFASFMMWPRKNEKKASEIYLTKTRYMVLSIIGGVAGFMNAILGVSGGIIIVPALTYVGFDVKKSVTTSAYVVLFTTIASLASYFYTREGLLIFFYKEHVLVLTLIVGCVVGSAFGNKLSVMFSSSILKKIFSILVFCVAIVTFINR